MTQTMRRNREVLDAIRAQAEGAIAAGAASVDAERHFPSDALSALADAGGFGLMADPTDAKLASLVEACETIGAACASSAMVFLMHSIMTATVAGGGGDRAEELLDRLAGGELGSLAFSERGTGAHFYSPDIKATEQNGGLRISGRKSFVTSGGHADIYLILVATEDGEGADCFAIEKDTPGLSFSGEWAGLGMAGNSSIAMELDNVEVTDADRIGEAGAGGTLVFGVVAPAFLAGLSAVNVGISWAALAVSVDHVKHRSYADGSDLVEVQAIQHSLAEMDLTANAAKLMVSEAARLADAGGEAALVALMEAKIAATDAARSVTEEALETCGGQAYTPALPIERHLRDARAGAVMAPTNGVLKTWVGKALAGLPVP